MKPRLRRIAFAIAVSAAAGLTAGVAAYAVPKIFSDETASATPSLGFASTVIARGTFAQNYTESESTSPSRRPALRSTKTAHLRLPSANPRLGPGAALQSARECASLSRS